MSIVEAKVKPDRARLAVGDPTARDRARRWWQFARPTLDLYATIVGKNRLLVGAQTAKYVALGWEPAGCVYSHATNVFAVDKDSYFAALSSWIHEVWAREYSGSLESRLRYSISECFETFPFPTTTADLDYVGQSYYSHRQSIMLARQEGLTSVYNHFHNSREQTADIRKLRELHAEMDRAVAAAYGWTTLSLGHDFHPTKQGIRFTISEAARRDILGRLLRLNHERYAEEVAQGLHDKKANKRTKSRVATKASDEPSFDFEEQEA